MSGQKYRVVPSPKTFACGPPWCKCLLRLRGEWQRFAGAMRRIVKIATVVAVIVSQLGIGVRAAEMDGVVLPDSLNIANNELVLSGCGIREVLWTDVYMVALYMPVPTRDARPIFDRALAKAVRVEIIYDGDVPEEMPTEWRRYLRQELSRDVFRAFRNLYSELEQGDVLLAGFTPGAGTAVTVNNETVATSPDSNIVDALLELWIGHDPVSKNLRRLLLKGDC